MDMNQLMQQLHGYVVEGACLHVTTSYGATSDHPVYALKYEGTATAGTLTVVGAGDGEKTHISTVYGITEDPDTGDIEFKVDNEMVLSINRNYSAWITAVLNNWYTYEHESPEPWDVLPAGLWYYRENERAVQKAG